MVNAFAQNQTEFPLRIGARMPEIIFHTMVNYPGNSAKLSDFIGRPVILDLWHVQCSACIQGMPHMQELQDRFKGKIQIIGFGLNNLYDYKKLKKTSSILKTITSLPLALQADTPLFKNLVGTYPTHIWIDKDGVIKAITNPMNATERNIQEFIDGKTLNFIMDKPKNAMDKYYPIDTSLLVQGNGGSFKKVLYNSLFTGRVEYSESSLGKLNLGPENPGIRRINLTLIDFLGYYWGLYHENHPKLIFETEDLKKYLVPKNDDEYDQWLQQNSYCYELNLPEGRKYNEDYLRQCLRQDVQRFFRINIEVVKQLTKCLILYRIDSIDRIKTKERSNSVENFKSNGFNKGTSYINFPMGKIANLIEGGLSWRQEPVKVIDETNYTNNVDLEFDSKLNDFNIVRAQLKKYGLGLKEEQRVIDCIMISKAE